MGHLSEFISSFAGSIANKDILEIGFGDGNLIPFFLQEGVSSYHGIDNSETAYQLAVSSYNDPAVKLELKKARKLDVTQSYDFIVLNDVIGYIPVFEMDVVWRKMKKVLRPGGLIVIKTRIYDNPNQADDLNNSLPAPWIQCNKQTMGTMFRSCLAHGFILAKRQGEWFGLVRRTDLPAASSLQRISFLNNHNKYLLKFGIQDSESYSKEQLRSIVPGAGRLLIGCVADNEEKYLEQMLRLVKSIRWFGGDSAGANVCICLVEHADSKYEKELKKWGAMVRIIPRFSSKHPFSNKLGLLELSETRSYDTVLLLDCDTIVVKDPYPYLNGRKLQAKIADKPSIPHRLFKKLLSRYSLPEPEQTYMCTVLEKPTIWYCNSGVLVFPSEMIDSFFPVWKKYTKELVKNKELMGHHYKYCDQASLTLAYLESAVPFKKLRVQMNFPLYRHYDDIDSLPSEMISCDPVIIHYHISASKSGLIGNSKFPFVQKRIALFNEYLQKNL